ncbi:conserved hypothetical protein [Hyphomonas neptunium ATCC 15444]|uniref:DUF4282 domain-containing protein n=2 Tax=Hyphomonas TaxID=85 RepID=Q0BXD2_HYPNA|nr:MULTISPECIES: DUF4282 domain-containing protein [Hyphomonas]ABI76625.1 conserved hypothetical protein [Hyphomonas neptunium ATCC 15444]KCZ89967.1 hypothetical protein HHI_14185 [Hyphomonas hirschiana VP5]
MLNQFLKFDKLIGAKLITILYYLGLIGIVLGLIAGVLSGLGTMVSYSFFGGIGLVIASLIGAVVGLLFWRFVCELYMLLFRMADDLRDIKVAKTPPAL